MRLKRALGAIALLCGSAAFAQNYPSTTDYGTTDYSASDYDRAANPQPTRGSSMSKNIRDTFAIRAGGGAEGYSGNLSDRFRVGPSWGATLSTQPLSWLGAEVGYTGAVNEASRRTTAAPDGLTGGADMVRNGGQVAATFSLPVPFLQPYGLAGVGVDGYNVRGGQQLGFQNDIAGRVPLGAGLRTKVGPFNADLRGTYNVLFSDNFSFSPTTGTKTSGNSYTALAQIGGRF